MDKQDYILLFNCLHPDFFEQEHIRNMPEEAVFEEMLLSLAEFDPHRYDKKFGDNISFGFYDGDLNELRKDVEIVEQHWGPFYDGKSRIYCGFKDGKVASFCMIEDMGSHTLDGRVIRIGGPGCVGTLPEYRDRGIGLTMVKNVTQILKEEGYDYSYIHYTGVAPWYEKLGYKTSIRWNKHGIL